MLCGALKQTVATPPLPFCLSRQACWTPSAMTNKEATKLTLPTTLHQAQSGQRGVEWKWKPIEAQGNVGFGQADRAGLDWQLDRPGMDWTDWTWTWSWNWARMSCANSVRFTRSFAHFFRFQFSSLFFAQFRPCSHLFRYVLSVCVCVCCVCVCCVLFVLFAGHWPSRGNNFYAVALVKLAWQSPQGGENGNGNGGCGCG